VVRHPIVQRIVDAYDEYDKLNIPTLNNPDKERLHERDN
jgi:phosphate starvation-inducible protein PhoH